MIAGLILLVAMFASGLIAVNTGNIFFGLGSIVFGFFGLCMVAGAGSSE